MITRWFPAILCFNPRVLAGGRDSQINRMGTAKKFQSTRPRGRTRPRSGTGTPSESSFNPRVLAGGRDTLDDAIAEGFVVSIHASSREDATCSPRCASAGQ